MEVATCIGLISSSFILYGLRSFVRRKIIKPNYIGKTVWITGASSGIGKYMAYDFNRAGAHVILSSRNTKELRLVQSSCPNPQRAEVVTLDMTNYNQLEKVTSQVLEKLERGGKKLDVIVENAGVGMRCQFLKFPFENHLKLFDVNVHAPYRHLQLVIPHMIKNKSGQIIGITSQAGKLATAYRTSYAGSKHAFIGILDSLRNELKPHGIRVCNIMPGYIRTNLSINALASGVGETFGENDSNIENGMDVQQFSKEAVASAYNNENEVSIAKQWAPIIGIILRNLCPDLVFRLLGIISKKQSKQDSKAKKQ